METGKRGFRLPRVRSPFGTDPPADAAAAQLATPQAGGVGAATPPLGAGRFSSSTRAFQHRNYRLFYMGQSISLIGTWMQTIAMGLARAQDH